MPCARGNILSIEQRRAQHEHAREAERAFLESSEYKFWQALVGKVYGAKHGFDSLIKGERLYFVINVLSREVHNGGFDQFFSNSSGDRYEETLDALTETGARSTLQLLQDAKAVLFGGAPVPRDRTARLAAMSTSSEDHPIYDAANSALDRLDKAFCADPDISGLCWNESLSTTGCTDSNVCCFSLPRFSSISILIGNLQTHASPPFPAISGLSSRHAVDEPRIHLRVDDRADGVYA